MSLIGRRIIDRLQKAVSSRWLLPVPPYESSEYWDNVYKRFPSRDSVFEWGDVHFERDLKEFSYTVPASFRDELTRCGFQTSINPGNKVRGQQLCGSLMEAAGLSLLSSDARNILLLGCGNSKLGEDLVQHFIDMSSTTTAIDEKENKACIPKIIQCDVSATVVDMMTQRHKENLIAQGLMSVLKDDATDFSFIQPNSMDAVMDKGLIDALYCAKKGSHIRRVMANAHKVLKQESSFLFFSFSRPEFILPEILLSGAHVNSDDTELWKDVEIRLLDQIILYRFVKGTQESSTRNRHVHSHNSNSVSCLEDGESRNKNPSKRKVSKKGTSLVLI